MKSAICKFLYALYGLANRVIWPVCQFAFTHNMGKVGRFINVHVIDALGDLYGKSCQWAYPDAERCEPTDYYQIMGEAQGVWDGEDNQ